MSDFRVSPDAEADLDSIWVHIARESGSLDVATQAVDHIAERFRLIASHPRIGRRRDDLRVGLRSLVVDDYLVIYRIDQEESVVILHVVHGSRDIGALFTS